MKLPHQNALCWEHGHQQPRRWQCYSTAPSRQLCHSAAARSTPSTAQPRLAAGNPHSLLIKRVGHSKRWPYPAQLTQSECPWSGQRSVLHCLQLPTAKPYLGSSGGRAGFPGEFLGKASGCDEGRSHRDITESNPRKQHSPGDRGTGEENPARSFCLSPPQSNHGSQGFFSFLPAQGALRTVRGTHVEGSCSQRVAGALLRAGTASGAWQAMRREDNTRVRLCSRLLAPLTSPMPQQGWYSGIN